MGILMSVVSKFKKKTSTKEILEQIDEDIDKYQETLQRNHQLKKSTVLFLLTSSIILYVLAATIFYLWYMPTKWSQRLLYVLPFLGFPVLVILLRKILHWVFVTRISKNSKILENLRKEKKKILENVMETETYKVAKELLQKFDPGRKLVERDTPTRETPQQSGKPGTDLRRRNIPGQQTPGSAMIPANQSQMVPAFTPRMPPHGAGMRTPAMQLRFPTPQGLTPRLPNAPILPRDRSFFDKVAEYFVGDGPSNRYALICSKCYSHNGMALMEEFEYIAFKCCYCQQFNPARKQRLNAPKLEDDQTKRPTLIRAPSSNKSSTEEEQEEEDNEVEANKNENTVHDDSNSNDEGIESGENLLLEKDEESSLLEDKEGDKSDDIETS